MPWNPRTCRLPTEQELEEPYVLLDRLADWVRRQHDPAEARWAVETLAAYVGVPIRFELTDPLQQMDALGDLWITAVMQAGAARGRRAQVVTNTRGKLRELADVLRWWVEDYEEREGAKSSPIGIAGWRAAPVTRQARRRT